MIAVVSFINWHNRFFSVGADLGVCPFYRFMNQLQKVIVCLLISAISVLAQTPTDDEFLPKAKTHLHGREIDARWFESVNASKAKSKTSDNGEIEVVTPADIRALIAGEQQRIRNHSVSQLAKAGISSTFKETISLVSIEGRFEILALYSTVNDTYIRTIEGAIRSNVFPPIIARATQQKVSVSVVFNVKRDGTITEIEKETSTGSNALDGSAISACRSSSPLPPLSTLGSENIIRMRFTLTYNP
jgi:TonB family protein